MENRYRLILSNNNFYREVQLPSSATQYRIGTTYECDCRFAKERFFTEFELLLTNDGDSWIVSCRKGNIYFQDKGTMKLKSYKLSHGTELHVLYQYQGSDEILFKLSYILDFEAEKANYERVLDVGGLQIVTFGRESNCDITLDDQLLGRDIVKLERRAGGLFVVDCGTRYGVYVNGVKIQGEEQINDYDFFSILGFSFYYKEGELYTSKYTKLFPGSISCREIADQNNHLTYPQFNRNTQVKINIPNEDITILDPPAKPEKPKQNIVMTLLPSLAMIALVVVMRGVMGGGNMSFVLYSAASMGLGVVTTIAGFITGNKEYKESVANREQEYAAYIQQKRGEIRAAQENERQLLEEIYISPEQEEENVQNFAGTLFDRTPEDKDFLTVRIGTGSQNATRKIAFKEKEQITVSDPLSEHPQRLHTEFSIIDNVPVVLPLASANAVGVIGDEDALYEFAKQSIVDICTRQYYDDVKMFLISGATIEQFAWARWLPHFSDSALNMRNFASRSEERTALLEYLYSELLQRGQQKRKEPHLVILVYNCTSLKNHPISKFISKASSLGVSFIFFENYREYIPQYCSRIINLQERVGEGSIVPADGSELERGFSYSSISDERAAKLAIKLAPVYCEEISLEGTLTKNISFFDMMGIFTVDDLDLKRNWSSAQIYKTMAAPVGVKTQNELVYLDLHEKAHGPHGLVAGTTGSGKSEALQTYILSMAITYHPYEVGFVIIDFKGGGMANQFEDLPHLIGTITNIDGREIERSLKSIKAELQKRQRVFAEAGVNNIGNYIRKFKAGEVSLPLPHLIIVVDEFAELKAEQPEFMKELISAARIGRSLGVHLILATQKPSGQVNEQIWSNSRFKLCLKVQTPQDSVEVIKSPLAAEIKEPGRAYLQVGNNELFELFQSAYSGAPATITDFGPQKEYNISAVSIAGRRQIVYQQKKAKSENNNSATQLEAIVDYVKDYCSKADIARLPAICLPSLADVIEYRNASIKGKNDVIVNIGVYDDPDNQYQGSAIVNLTAGNTIVVGSSQMGKTNLLQTVLRSVSENYSPRETNVYILDFASMALNVFESLNHVGGVVLAADDEKLKNLMRMLRTEIKQRKEIFSQMGITSFVSYKDAGHKDIPHILVVVDNFIALKELYPEYEDDLLNICREGVSVGITLVITSLQTNGISYKYLSNFSNRLCLYCNQSEEYSNLLDKCRMEPKNVPGRGLFALNKSIFEYQTFLAFNGEKEIERVEEIRIFIKKANAKYIGQKAKRIPEVPQILDASYVKQNGRGVQSKVSEVVTGIDYDTVEFVAIDLAKINTIGITGREGYGKTNLVRLLLSSLQQKVFDYPSEVYIFDDYDKQLEPFSSLGIVEKYTIDLGELEDTLTEIEQELQDRLSLVKTEGAAALIDRPLLFVVVQNNAVFSPDGLSKAGVEAYKRILKTYKNMKVCFVFSNIENTAIAYGAPEMLKQVKEFNSLYVMDDLANLKLVDVTAATLRQYKKLIELGDCYTITDKGVQKQKIINMRGEKS